MHSERKFIVDNDISSEAIANSKLKIEKFSIEQTYLAPRSDSAENVSHILPSPNNFFLNN